MALYGTLMRGEEGYRELQLDGKVNFIGPCSFSGQLYDLGAYPGFILDGAGVVQGELFELVADDVLSELDDWELFDASSSASSEYIREWIPLVQPRGYAWVYVYNTGKRAGWFTEKAQPIESGDWRAHVRQRR